MSGNNDDPFNANSESAQVKIIAPDFSLKKKIGDDVEIKKYLTGEAVVEVQKTIDAQQPNFLEWVASDLITIETCYNAASQHIEACEPDIKKLSHTAFVIKSQAGTFGYDLGSQVAKSLDDFCTKSFRPQPDHLVVVRKHIDTLQLIFRKSISGNGGEIGAQLLGGLQLLTEKYKK